MSSFTLLHVFSKPYETRKEDILKNFGTQTVDRCH